MDAIMYPHVIAALALVIPVTFGSGVVAINRAENDDATAYDLIACLTLIALTIVIVFALGQPEPVRVETQVIRVPVCLPASTLSVIGNANTLPVDGTHVTNSRITNSTAERP